MGRTEELLQQHVLLERGWVKPHHISECRRLLAFLNKKGFSKSLLDVLLSKGYLTAEQVCVLSQTPCPITGYKFIRKLGEGGLGIVYLARQRVTKEKVAIKILNPEIMATTKELERFLQEARALISFNHPHIIKGFESGEVAGLYYIVMEYSDGPSLCQHIQHSGPLSIRVALKVTSQILQALMHVWQHGVLHRDVKPENILLTTRGQAKLCDLGLAKLLDAQNHLTQTGVAIGTPYYMSPEQFAGNKHLDYRTDLYSLGGTLYFMLTGHRPFKGSTFTALAFQHATLTPIPPSQYRPCLGKGIDALILRWLAKKPEQRASTPAQALKQLMQLRRAPGGVQSCDSRADGGEVSNTTGVKLLTDAPQSSRTAKRYKSVTLEETTEESLFATKWWSGLVVIPVLLVGLLVAGIWGGKTTDSITPQRVVILPKQVNLRPGQAYQFRAVVFDQDNQPIRAVLHWYASGGQIDATGRYVAGQEPGVFTIKVKESRGGIGTQTVVRIVAVQHLLPNGWPRDLWRQCWNGKWVDFSHPTWLELSSIEQLRYAHAYQLWYGQQQGLQVSRKLRGGHVYFEMLLIPPGQFLMGSPAAEKGRAIDEYRHPVVISWPYYLGKYEITQQQWREVTGEAPWAGQKYMQENPQHAAAYISWQDIKYKLLPNLGRRWFLPTEAQWEYACRAGTTTCFYWGAALTEMEKYANVCDLTTKKEGWLPPSWNYCRQVCDGYALIAPVGSLRPNAFGLHDMLGNVWEWCQDKYAGDYYRRSPLHDPCNFGRGLYRVSRGASWGNYQLRYLRCASRRSYLPSYWASNLGGRVGARP